MSQKHSASKSFEYIMMIALQDTSVSLELSNYSLEIIGFYQCPPMSKAMWKAAICVAERKPVAQKA